MVSFQSCWKVEAKDGKAESHPAVLLNKQASYAKNMPKHPHLLGKRLQVTAIQRCLHGKLEQHRTSARWPSWAGDFALTKFVSFDPKIGGDWVTIFVPYGNTDDDAIILPKLDHQSGQKDQFSSFSTHYCHLASSLLKRGQAGSQSK